MSDVVRAALVQAEWTGDKESMVDKNIQYALEAADQGGADPVFSGDIQHVVLLCGSGHPLLRPGRGNPERPDHSADDGSRQGNGDGVDRAHLRTCR